MKKGFTLLEILIAFAISGFVIIAVYDIFNTSLNVKTASEKSARERDFTISMENIFVGDMFSLVSEPVDISNNGSSKTFSFKSMRSLFFSSGIPVKITYLLEKDKLFRTEESEKLGYSEKFTIAEDIKEFRVFGFDGNDFKEDYTQTNLFKFKISSDKKTAEISAGNIFYAE